MYIDCHIIHFTRIERGDNTNRISPTDNAVKLFMWRSIDFQMINFTRIVPICESPSRERSILIGSYTFQDFNPVSPVNK